MEDKSSITETKATKCEKLFSIASVRFNLKLSYYKLVES